MKFRMLGTGRARAQQHYERALQYYDAGKIEMAVADLSEAIAYNRRRVEFYVARGLFWFEMDELAYAESDFESALRLNPDEMIAHYGLGMVAHAEGRYEDGVHHFTHALECDPERGECYYFRSICHYESGALEQAEIDMDFARQLLLPDDPRQLDAARWLALFRRDREKIRRRPRRIDE